MKRVNGLNALLVVAVIFFGSALSFSLTSTEVEASASSNCLICVGDDCIDNFFGGSWCSVEFPSGENCDAPDDCSVYVPVLEEEV